MKTLTLSGKHIHSLEELYDQITRDLHLDRAIFGRNLDALYDVLSDASVDKIVILENTLLKKSLQRNHRSGTSEYGVLLDILTDLQGVTISIFS